MTMIRFGRNPRIQVVTGARRSGSMQAMTDLVDQCVAEYDETGLLDEHWR
jgi:4-hydroxyphenylacetate 3-monooxygenase